MKSQPSRKSVKKSGRKLAYPTWEHPTGSGIKIAEMPNRTAGEAFGVCFQVRIPAELLGRVGNHPLAGQRQIVQKKTKVEAERFAEDRFVALRKYGTSFADIPPLAQKQAIVAWGILKEHGIDFVAAAETAVRVLRPAGGQRTVAQVLQELRDSKKTRFDRGDLRARSWDDYRTRTAKIEQALGSKPINLITRDELAAWLRQLSEVGVGSGPLGSRSVKNYRNCLSELFGHATKKGYCPDNVMARFTREEMSELGGQKNKRAAVNVLTIEEALKLLKESRNHLQLGLLPSVVLRLFCGLRTEEIVRLSWNDVRWQEPQPYVHISEDQAKGRAARNVTIPDNALEWLTLCPFKTGPISPRKDSPGYCKRFRRLQKLAGFGETNPKTGKWVSTWETNDTRHSFGSYHFACHGNSILTSEQMGHKQGDTVLFNHYRKLTTKAEGQRYFALRPEQMTANVTSFPAAATG